MNRNGVILKNNIKAVIFDLDGTLVDSEPNYAEADNKTLTEYGIVGFDAKMKNKYVGVGTKEMMEEIKKIYDINESVENLVAKKNKYYLEIAKKNTFVFPEMYKFLQFLKSNKYPLALASGSSPEIIEIILLLTDLKKYFDVVLSAEQVKEGKPAPDIFFEAAKQLGIPFENCLVIEDSQPGVEAAKSASMYCMAVPYMMEEALNYSFIKADLVFKNGISEFRAEKAIEWLQAKG